MSLSVATTQDVLELEKAKKYLTLATTLVDGKRMTKMKIAAMLGIERSTLDDWIAKWDESGIIAQAATEVFGEHTRDIHAATMAASMKAVGAMHDVLNEMIKIVYNGKYEKDRIAAAKVVLDFAQEYAQLPEPIRDDGSVELDYIRKLEGRGFDPTAIVKNPVQIVVIREQEAKPPPPKADVEAEWVIDIQEPESELGLPKLAPSEPKKKRVPTKEQLEQFDRIRVHNVAKPAPHEVYNVEESLRDAFGDPEAAPPDEPQGPAHLPGLVSSGE